MSIVKNHIKDNPTAFSFEIPKFPNRYIKPYSRMPKPDKDTGSMDITVIIGIKIR